MANLGLIRSDIIQLKAYIPNPGGELIQPLDRLDANECPYDLPLEFKEQLAWTYQHKIENNRYPDGGHLGLKEAIASYLNESLENPTQVTSANISVGNGSDELIRSLLIATCLNSSGSILVANPTFSMYEILAKTLGIKTISVGRSETNFETNLLEAQEALKNEQNPPIRVIFVVNPNSPTGNLLTTAEIDWLSNLPDDILVVIDEAYFEFSQESLLSQLPKHPNWVILRTFSKAFRLAAHRVGYAIASPELTLALEKIRLPYNLPSFSQIAAQLVLEHRQDLLAFIPEIVKEREILFNNLSQLPELKIWPSRANFLYLRPNSDPENIVNQLKLLGTLIRHTGGGLRITVGTPQENQNTIKHFQTFYYT
jgi:histidinol-phosphate aminotransferase